jgi:hypothetical protein
MPERIYNYLFKETSLMRLAYGKWELLANTIISIISGYIIIYVALNSESSKTYIWLTIYFISLIIFIAYSMRRAINKHHKVGDSYNYNNIKVEYSKLKYNMLLSYINDKGLYNSEGIRYLMNNFYRRSEKHKFGKLAIGVIIIASTIQSLIDLAVKGEWRLLYSYWIILRGNYHVAIGIIIIAAICLLLYKFGVLELLNTKSNNYRKLAVLLENNILPLVIYNQSMDEAALSFNAEAKQECHNKADKKIIIRINKDRKLG